MHTTPSPHVLRGARPQRPCAVVLRGYEYAGWVTTLAGGVVGWHWALEMALAPLSEHTTQLEEFRAPALPPRSEAPWIYPTPA